MSIYIAHRHRKTSNVHRGYIIMYTLSQKTCHCIFG